MRRALFLIVIALGCREAPEAPNIDTREPIAVHYVGAPGGAVVRAKPDDAAAEVTKFLNGESVSVLATRGDWIEVRTGISSGWVRAADLTNAREAAAQQESLTPRFRILPAAISAPTVRGTVYIEAHVNTDGDVTSTKLITNTTGRPDLAAQNESALRRAKFFPIVQKGEKKVFVYYHRIDY